MKFYLSSFKIGNEPEKLRGLFSKKKKIAYIANALDSKKITKDWLTQHIQSDMQALKNLGLEVEQIDLRNFFDREEALQDKIDKFGGVWISGGNVFILRQAMRLSGFDKILKSVNPDFVYGGYSAAACVLSPNLDAYKIVDDSNDLPYEEQREIIWDGLEYVSYAFLPHYDSDHSESENIRKEIQYCIEKKIPFIALRDGEVIIF